MAPLMLWLLCKYLSAGSLPGFLCARSFWSFISVKFFIKNDSTSHTQHHHAPTIKNMGACVYTHRVDIHVALMAPRVKKWYQGTHAVMGTRLLVQLRADLLKRSRSKVVKTIFVSDVQYHSPHFSASLPILHTAIGYLA